jgi:HSP20 family protein
MSTLIKNNNSPLKNIWDDFFAQDRLDQNFFNWRFLNNVPAANVRETDKSFRVELAAPGMKKEDFKIEIGKGEITISAERKEEKTTEEGKYTRQEYNYASFSRSFNIPENVDENSISATYQDGLLKIELPKTPGAETKKSTRSVNIV